MWEFAIRHLFGNSYKENVSSRYTNVRKHQVEEILLKHIKPRSLNKRIKHNIFDLVDTFLSDDKLYKPDKYH